MSEQAMRVFTTAFKESVVRRLEAGEALAAVSKELGIARKLLYDWRWAWKRDGAAGLNRRRGPKPGKKRLLAMGRPPDTPPAGGVAAAGSAPVLAEELARARERIGELERKIGRQALDLDFFHKALQLAGALGASLPASGAKGSTRSSKE